MTKLYVVTDKQIADLAFTVIHQESPNVEAFLTEHPIALNERDSVIVRYCIGEANANANDVITDFIDDEVAGIWSNNQTDLTPAERSTYYDHASKVIDRLYWTIDKVTKKACQDYQINMANWRNERTNVTS